MFPRPFRRPIEASNEAAWKDWSDNVQSCSHRLGQTAGGTSGPPGRVNKECRKKVPVFFQGGWRSQIAIATGKEQKAPCIWTEFSVISATTLR